MSEVVSTERIGQLTGSSRTQAQPELTTDWMFWPLLNETRLWDVTGVDLGANAEHNDRLYFFFGDVANPGNPDLVCWTDDAVVQRHGGHLAIGWDFRLPNDHQGATPTTGQWQWRFCWKCHGIFFSPQQQEAGVCPAGGAHAPLGWNFVLPNDHQGATDATGQRDWRPCDRCAGLFYAPAGDASGTVCPAGGPHRVPAGSWVFFLPARETGASDAVGQPQWRFCANCHSLYWNGDSIKGVCPGAPGGGIRLNAVLGTRRLESQGSDAGRWVGKFAPFTVDPPINGLGSNETPTGAFSHAGRAYVFVWVNTPDPNDPKPIDPRRVSGSYLTSKADPSAAGNYRIEQMISPLSFTTTSFSQIAAVKINNADFPGLFPSSTGTGVVLFGQGHNTRLTQEHNELTDGIHLAWSSLPDNPGLAPLQMSYYTGSTPTFSADPNQAMPLAVRNGYTSLSAAWLGNAHLWILLYGTANGVDKGGPVNGPIIARLGRTPFELAVVPTLKIFDPDRERAWGNYMHQPGLDCINPDLPPSEPHGHDDPGWAYGAHLLNRYTKWDPDSGLLDIFYLLSTASPYQVHLIHTVIRPAFPPVWAHSRRAGGNSISG